MVCRLRFLSRNPIIKKVPSVIALSHLASNLTQTALAFLMLFILWPKEENFPYSLTFLSGDADCRWGRIPLLIILFCLDEQ